MLVQRVNPVDFNRSYFQISMFMTVAPSLETGDGYICEYWNLNYLSEVFQRVPLFHISLKSFGDTLDPRNSVGFDLWSKMLLLCVFLEERKKVKKIKLRNIRREGGVVIISVWEVWKMLWQQMKVKRLLASYTFHWKPRVLLHVTWVHLVEGW